MHARELHLIHSTTSHHTAHADNHELQMKREVMKKTFRNCSHCSQTNNKSNKENLSVNKKVQAKFRLIFEGEIFGYEYLTEDGWKNYTIELDTNEKGEILRENCGVIDNHWFKNSNFIRRDEFTGFYERKSNKEIYANDVLEGVDEMGGVIKGAAYFEDGQWRFGKQYNGKTGVHSASIAGWATYGVTILGWLDEKYNYHKF